MLRVAHYSGKVENILLYFATNLFWALHTNFIATGFLPRNVMKRNCYQNFCSSVCLSHSWVKIFEI